MSSPMMTMQNPYMTPGMGMGMGMGLAGLAGAMAGVTGHEDPTTAAALNFYMGGLTGPGGAPF